MLLLRWITERARAICGSLYGPCLGPSFLLSKRIIDAEHLYNQQLPRLFLPLFVDQVIVWSTPIYIYVLCWRWNVPMSPSVRTSRRSVVVGGCVSRPKMAGNFTSKAPIGALVWLYIEMFWPCRRVQWRAASCRGERPGRGQPQGSAHQPGCQGPGAKWDG